MATKTNFDQIITFCASCKHGITRYQMEEEALGCHGCGVTVCEDCWHCREWGSTYDDVDETYLCEPCIAKGVTPATVVRGPNKQSKLPQARRK